MMKKIPVTLSPYIKTRNPYNKLKICRRCNHFTVLGDELCPVCGKDALLGVEQRAASMLKKSMWGARAIVILIWAISLVVSQSILLL
jgi:predicted amidophosphoribosyltransferase